MSEERSTTRQGFFSPVFSGRQIIDRKV